MSKTVFLEGDTFITVAYTVSQLPCTTQNVHIYSKSVKRDDMQWCKANLINPPFFILSFGETVSFHDLPKTLCREHNPAMYDDSTH